MTRSDDGFTLAEALMALLIISLAMAGLMQASRMVGQVDRRLAVDKQAEKARLAFSQDLNTKLSPLQPLLGDKIRGDAGAVHYPCPEGDCVLRPPQGSLAYLTDGAAHGVWPPQAVVPDAPPPLLAAVLWRDPRGKNLAVIKFPVEHSRDCIFDMISRTCLQPDSAASAS